MAVARADSLRVELHRQTSHLQDEIDLRDQRISWLEEDRPPFYAKPEFLVPVVMVVTVYATLKTVQYAVD